MSLPVTSCAGFAVVIGCLVGDWVGGHPGANDLAPRPRGAPRTRPCAERGEYSEGARGKGALTAHPVIRETSTTIHRRPRGSGTRSAGPLRSPEVTALVISSPTVGPF